MIYFTSDLHFGHKGVIEYAKRPFIDVGHMDSEMIRRWNETVSHDDTIYVLGDFSFRRPADTLDIVLQLNGKKHLILGNHDKKISKEVTALFASVDNLKEIRVEDHDLHIGYQEIVLCHYAMRVWNKSHYGSWMLYGHSHGSLPDDPTKKSTDVGVDRWNFRPVSYETLKTLMSERRFEAVDHHGKNSQR